MTTYFVPSITVDQVIDAVGDYVALFTSAQIIRGNVNRTAMPIDPFVVLTEISTVALNKPTSTYGDTTATLIENNQIDIQIDFYGWALSEVARAVHSSLRTIWSVDKFPVGIKPLYASDPKKLVWDNAEQQYEQRWMMMLSLQYNPEVIVPQNSFNTNGSVECIPVDEFIPHPI